jgi:hypothetical protein
MAEKLEQRAAVKFCSLLGKTAGEAVVMLETAYKKAALGKTQVYEWFSYSIDCCSIEHLSEGSRNAP